MSRTDKFLSLTLWFCVIGFICRVVTQEIALAKSCAQQGGAMVISSNFSSICVRRALEAMPND